MSSPNSIENRRFFIKQLSLLSAGFYLPTSSSDLLLTDHLKTSNLLRSTPESQGISSSDLLKFINAAEKSDAGLHSFMVVRHGYVVVGGWWSPYEEDIPHMLYSLSKNVTSTAIGMLVDEKRLNIETKVISFFPNDLPEHIDDKLAAMTVRDLLTMSGGHGEDTLRPLMANKTNTWAKTFFSIPLKYNPGERFVYNSGNTYMLSAILTKITSMSMLDYLQPRLFKPLGITGAGWDANQEGINFAAAGLRLKTEDLAKFGQLYLQKGKWKGKQILSEAWIKEATKFQIRNDLTGTPTKTEEDDIKQGYGYQFWLSRPQGKGAYRAEGAFCNYSIIMPEQDAVVVYTSEGLSTKRMMDLTWDILLPSMQDKVLPPNKTAHRELKAKLAALELPPSKSNVVSPLVGLISGKLFSIENNPRKIQSVSFQCDKDKILFTLKDDTGSYPIRCGMGKWIYGNTSIPGSPTNLLSGIPLWQKDWKVAASASWKDEKTLVMVWRFYESAHYDIITCRFEGVTVSIEFANSITRILKQYKDPRPSILGRMSN